MLRALPVVCAVLAFAAPASAQVVSEALQAAVADPGRPETDRSRDAGRHPAEVLAFAQVAPGQTVIDLVPGGGYFTRILARAVSPGGRVYAVVPTALAQVLPTAADKVRAATTDYPDVEVRVEPAVAPADTTGRVDLVWTAQNYHDFHNMGPDDVAALNRAVFAALKPGGLYVIEDHVAATGHGVSDTKTLHRMDPAAARAEVEKAGFVFDGETTILANPKDDHTLKVFDLSIRGRTDQFVYRFRKPT